jgi:hypothetical protein
MARTGSSARTSSRFHPSWAGNADICRPVPSTWTSRSSGTASGQAAGWGWRASAAVGLAARPATTLCRNRAKRGALSRRGAMATGVVRAGAKAWSRGLGACVDRARPRTRSDPAPRALKAPLSPQRHADEGRHPRQANVSALRPIGDSGLRRNDGEVGAYGPRATSPDAEGDPGPRAHLRRPSPRSVMPTKVGIHDRQTFQPCGLSEIPAFAGMAARLAPAWPARHLPGRRRRSGAPCALKAPLSPQRHADEGRHPRQANVSALRPIGDSGLRRNGGEVGASMARAPPPRTPKAIRAPRAFDAHMRARFCGRGRPRSRCYPAFFCIGFAMASSRAMRM